METRGKKGPEVMGHDECPRPETTREALHKLPTVFKKDGTVTAGRAGRGLPLGWRRSSIGACDRPRRVQALHQQSRTALLRS